MADKDLTLQQAKERLRLQKEYNNLYKEEAVIRERLKTATAGEREILEQEKKLLIDLSRATLNRSKALEEELSLTNQINESLSKTFDQLGLKVPTIMKNFMFSTKSLGQHFKDLGKKAKDVANILTSWKGALGLAFTIFGKILDAQERVNEVMREWRRSIAIVAKEIGGIGTNWEGIHKSVGKVWGKMASLGWSIEEAGEHVKTILLNMSSTNKEAQEAVDWTTDWAQGLGMGSELAGKLAFTLKKAKLENKEIKMMQFDIINVSKKLNVPISQISKDIGEASDYMAVFGKKGIQSLPVMVGYARQFGVAFGNVAKAMTTFDKLSSSSEAVSRIGAIFGVQINAMKMLVTTDPAKRLEEVRSAVLSTGKEWKNMSYYEIKALSTSLNLSEREIQSIFDKKNEYKSVAEIEKSIQKERINEEEAEKTRKKDMNKLLRETSTLFRDLTPQIKSFYTALNNAFAPLYDAIFGAKKNALQGLTDFFNRLSKDPVWHKFLTDLGNTIKWLGEVFREAMKSLTPDMLKKIVVGYGAIVALRTVGGGSISLGKGGMGGFSGLGGIRGTRGAAAGAAGLGLSTLINAGLGHIGAAKMGGGAVAGGSIGAGVGGMVGGLPGAIGGYGLGLMGGTLYDLFKKGPSKEELAKGSQKGAITEAQNKIKGFSDSMGLISQKHKLESEQKRFYLNQIAEEMNKKEKNIGAITESSIQLENMGVKINTLSKQGIKNLIDNLNKSDTAFDGLLQKLEMMKPVKEEIAMKEKEYQISLAEQKEKMKLKEFNKKYGKYVGNVIDAEGMRKAAEGMRGQLSGLDPVEELKINKEMLKDAKEFEDYRTDKIKLMEKLEEKRLDYTQKMVDIQEAAMMRVKFEESDVGKMTYATSEDRKKAMEKFYREQNASKGVMDIINKITPQANGGIITHPTLALVGERGPEKITPLTGPNAGGTIYMQPVDLIIDSKKLGQAMVRFATSGG